MLRAESVVGLVPIGPSDSGGQTGPSGPSSVRAGPMGSRVRGEDEGVPGGDASGVWRGAWQEGLPGQVRGEALSSLPSGQG